MQKKKLLAGLPKDGLVLLWLQKDQTLFLPEQPLVETVTPLVRVKARGPQIRLLFTQDAFIVAHEIHPNLMTCREIVFARADRKMDGLSNAEVIMYPRLARALNAKGIRSVTVPGGIGRMVAYPDEMIVADFGRHKDPRIAPRGWIIRKTDILPTLETGKTSTVWAEHIRSPRDRDNCTVMLYNHDPTDDEYPEFSGPDIVDDDRIVRQVFRVDMDSGSRIVKRIYDQSNQVDALSVRLTNEREPFHAIVGKTVKSYVFHNCGVMPIISESNTA